jgi:hypothetical protein
MRNRLLAIALLQVLALVGWSIYTNYRLAREQHRADQCLVSGFNQGVDAMSAGVLRSNVVKADDGYKSVLDSQDALQRVQKDWSGLDEHLADWMIAVPAGALSLLSIVTLLMEAKRSEERNRSGIAPEPASAIKGLNEF